MRPEKHVFKEDAFAFAVVIICLFASTFRKLLNTFSTFDIRPASKTNF